MTRRGRSARVGSAAGSTHRRHVPTRTSVPSSGRRRNVPVIRDGQACGPGVTWLASPGPAGQVLRKRPSAAYSAPTSLTRDPGEGGGGGHSGRSSRWVRLAATTSHSDANTFFSGFGSGRQTFVDLPGCRDVEGSGSPPVIQNSILSHLQSAPVWAVHMSDNLARHSTQGNRDRPYSTFTCQKTQ